MTQQDITSLTDLLDFLENAPEDPAIIAMDCNDQCEQMAALAERVAHGESLSALLPELQQHIHYWRDCREEFMALVAVLRAELAAERGADHPDAPRPA